MYLVNRPCTKVPVLLQIMEYNAIMNWPYTKLPVLKRIMGNSLLNKLAQHKTQGVITDYGIWCYNKLAPHKIFSTNTDYRKLWLKLILKKISVLLCIIEYNAMINWHYTKLSVVIWIMASHVSSRMGLRESPSTITDHRI